MMTSHPCKPVVSVTSSASNSSAKFGLRTLFFLALMFLASSFVFCRAESEVPEDTRRWSNGVGLWGKRSPPSVSAADLLDGMVQRSARLVHKRPEDSWHKLNSLWGKRSAASNWQTATGLWGKRSAPPLARFEAAAADYDANIWPRS